MHGKMSLLRNVVAGAYLGNRVADSVEEPELKDYLKNATIGGATVQTLLKIKEYPKRVRNTVDDYYTQGALNNLSKVEKKIDKAFGARGTKAVASYRSLKDTLPLRYDDGQFIRNRQVMDLRDTYENLGLDKRDAVKDYRRYIKTVKSPNTSIEEYRLLIDRNRAEKPHLAVQKQIKLVEKRLEKVSNPKIRTALDRRLKKLYKESREIAFTRKDRLLRSEIAKQEVQAGVLFDEKWDSSRLKQAGYEYKGKAQWKNLHKYIPKTSKLAWEEDIGKNNLVSKALLGDYKNREAYVFKNIHRGDKTIFGKMSKNIHHFASDLSYQIATGQINNKAQLNILLDDYASYGDEFFKLSRRQFNDIAIKSKGGKLYTYNDYLTNNAVKRSANRVMLEKVKNEITQTAFRTKKGLKGHFQLKSLGQVTAQYFEGGVNMVGEYQPYVGRDGRIKVAVRRTKTDVHDIFGSGKYAYKNVPLLVDEYNHRYYQKMDGEHVFTTTRDKKYPFKTNQVEKLATEEDFSSFKGRGKLQKKFNVVLDKVKKNPKAQLLYRLKKQIPLAKAFVVLETALIAKDLLADTDAFDFLSKD